MLNAHNELQKDTRFSLIFGHHGRVKPEYMAVWNYGFEGAEVTLGFDPDKAEAIKILLKAEKEYRNYLDNGADKPSWL